MEQSKYLAQLNSVQPGPSSTSKPVKIRSHEEYVQLMSLAINLPPEPGLIEDGLLDLELENIFGLEDSDSTDSSKG